MFLALAIFPSMRSEKKDEKMAGAKKVVKISFFAPVNYTKEFLKSINTGVVFLQFLATASNGCQYSRRSNWLKIGKHSVYNV